LLTAVAANTPADYAFTEELPDGSLRMRFWDRDDFIYHVTRLTASDRAERSIHWAPNAYGRAHYYLGFLAVKRRQCREAIAYLDTGMTREPDQPQLFLEKGKALTQMREFEAALDQYETVLARGLEVPLKWRGVALRGKGFVLIELGDLDEAERYFRESLKIEPESSVAKNELQYIANLRAGGRKTHTETVAFGGQAKPIVCTICSQPMTGGSVLNREGQVVYVCSDCDKAMRERKPWWQFWKR